MQMSDYEQRGTGGCLYLKRWCKTHHLFLLILHYAILCFFELSRKFFQISRYINLLWADLLTGTACDAVPRLFALFHAGFRIFLRGISNKFFRRFTTQSYHTKNLKHGKSRRQFSNCTGYLCAAGLIAFYMLILQFRL